MAEIEVHVITRAQRDEIGEERAGRLLIRLTALCRLVARRAGVPPRRVSIVRGHAARDKVVRVEGLTASQLRASVTRPRG